MKKKCFWSECVFKGICTVLQRRGCQQRWPVIAKASPTVVNGYWRLDLPTGEACHFPIFPPIDFACFYSVMAFAVNPFWPGQSQQLQIRPFSTSCINQLTRS